jgi:tetratricopeptide (TPR) repeat protein
MQKDRAMELFERGLQALSNDEPVRALSFFERALSIEPLPIVKSYLAYCIARERGQVSHAISLCEEAISVEKDNPLHYLNLGRIYLIKRDKIKAIQIFRAGLKHGIRPEIIEELERLGTRKTTVIPFLKRKNPINKYLGLVLSKLRLR